MTGSFYVHIRSKEIKWEWTILTVLDFEQRIVTGQQQEQMKLWYEHYQYLARNDRNDHKMTKKWPRNDQEMTEKWLRNDQEMTKKWPRNDQEMTENEQEILLMIVNDQNNPLLLAIHD